MKSQCFSSVSESASAFPPASQNSSAVLSCSVRFHRWIWGSKHRNGNSNSGARGACPDVSVSCFCHFLSLRFPPTILVYFVTLLQSYLSSHLFENLWKRNTHSTFRVQQNTRQYTPCLFWNLGSNVECLVCGIRIGLKTPIIRMDWNTPHFPLVENIPTFHKGQVSY